MLKEATYRKATRFGDVSIGWTYDGSRLTTRLVVPVGVRLTLHTPTALPLGGGELLRLVESGATLWSRGELQADASGRVRPGRPAGVATTEATPAAVLTTVLGGEYVFDAAFAV